MVHSVPRVFISYCHADISKARKIEEDLTAKGLELVRDERALKYTEDIESYMKKIRATDYALLLVSDAFLRSTNCMFEVHEFLKDENHRDRVLPVIIDDYMDEGIERKGAQIYTDEGAVGYVCHWQDRERDLRKQLEDVDIANLTHFSRKLFLIQSITKTVADFIFLLREIKHVKLDDLINREYRDILEKVGYRGIGIGDAGGVPAPRESELLKLAERLPTVKLGGFDLECTLIPGVPRRFFDWGEAENSVELDLMKDALLPADAVTATIAEIDERLTYAQPPDYLAQLAKIRERLKLSARYARLVEPPEVIANPRGGKDVRLRIGEIDYGLGYAWHRRTRVSLDTVGALGMNYSLNLLAIRIAAVYEENSRLWVALQQRDPSNDTYAEAWDVGAAGFVSTLGPQIQGNHRDPEKSDRISLWWATHNEMSEELSLDPAIYLQQREQCEFYGISQIRRVGGFEILGAYYLKQPPDQGRAVRKHGKVCNYDCCPLVPEDVVQCVIKKRYWLPTALLTLKLLLEAKGFDPLEINRAFSRCEGKVRLDPWLSRE